MVLFEFYSESALYLQETPNKTLEELLYAIHEKVVTFTITLE